MMDAIRLHVEGDWVSRSELDAVCDTCSNMPQTDVLTYTKKYELVNDRIKEHGALPSNLKQLFSAWDGMEMDNPYHMPLFIVAKNIADFNRLTAAYGERGRTCQHVKENGDGTFTVTVRHCNECYMSHLKGNGHGGCWDVTPTNSAEVMAVVALAH